MDPTTLEYSSAYLSLLFPVWLIFFPFWSASTVGPCTWRWLPGGPTATPARGSSSGAPILRAMWPTRWKRSRLSATAASAMIRNTYQTWNSDRSISLSFDMRLRRLSFLNFCFGKGRFADPDLHGSALIFLSGSGSRREKLKKKNLKNARKLFVPVPNNCNFISKN